MYYNLFLDDERRPKDVTWVDLPPVNWIIATSYSDFVRIINENGLPSNISFDHDLGDNSYKELIGCIKDRRPFNYNNLKEEKTGLDCAKFLVEYCIKYNLKIPKYYIHTFNPFGKHNIERYLNSYGKSL